MLISLRAPTFADVFPCFGVVAGRTYRLLLGPCLKCCGYWRYTDDWKPSYGDIDLVRAADLVGMTNASKGLKPRTFTSPGPWPLSSR